MGKSMEKHFKERFGGRRITVVYPDRPLTGYERCLANEKIFKAFTSVLAGILKREPTTNELSGLEDVLKSKKTV